MILKMTNKTEGFYNYMGKFFGSRIVQSETNDRIYDDNNKIWYIYLNNEIPSAFVSISNNVIKNIYAIDSNFLSELLTTIQKEISIQPSIVTKIYLDVYVSCGLQVLDAENYKNFVTIRSEINEKENRISSLVG